MINISKTMYILGKKYPRSTTTLNTMRGNASAFEILISCLLSLRARDEALDSLTYQWKGSASLEKLNCFTIGKAHAEHGNLCNWRTFYG